MFNVCFAGAEAQTDTLLAKDFPEHFGTDYRALASALTLDLNTQRQKANAIYNWVTRNIAYDPDGMWRMSSSDEDIVVKTLRTGKAVCSGYAALFSELCKAAGMQAVTIDGYAKDWMTDNGDEQYIPRHEWSAVKIDGKWELVDATWGAGGLYQSTSLLRKILNAITFQKKLTGDQLKFKFKYDPKYFAPDPEEFRLKHLPADPLWQLTDSTMPLAVFEAGDSAIRVFNRLYSKPYQTDPRLDRIAELDNKQKIYEYADRAYAYNKKFPGVMAEKGGIRAEAAMERALSDTSLEEPGLLIKNARNEVKTAVARMDEQKKMIPAQYGKLKKKNKDKAMAAKQHIREVRTDDKKQLAMSKRYAKNADTRMGRTKKAQARVEKKLQDVEPGKLPDIATGKVRKKPDDPILRTLKDSVGNRKVRIAAMQEATNKQGIALKADVERVRVQLDTLASVLTVEDSLLREEAAERMMMHDSYDDEVIKWSTLFKQQKYKVSDSVLKQYFVQYDSTGARYERLFKEQVNCLGMYRTSIREMEQYKKASDADPELANDYAAVANEALAYGEQAEKDMATYATYLKANKALFQQLEKLSKRQMSIVDYMEKAEKSRDKLEQAAMAKNREFDKKELEKHKTTMNAGLRKLDRVVKNNKL